MRKILFLFALQFFSLLVSAGDILVRNPEELKRATANARPGDRIVLKNGEWHDVFLELSGSGTETQPVIFRAETPGKVRITGYSRLRIAGTYVVVDGFFFVNGYSGDDPVITYRISKDRLAIHCRVTNCSIDSFSNPQRMDENSWVAFYGKNNRLDHCSFRNKLNLGVLLAVILDDDRCRENFHSIDNNYFGNRAPLASNGGEIIRVGVSQHCQYNSNTQIVDNLFEHCDGEAEVISIKSGANEIRRNIFKECQGSVVLRHGNGNTVANNIFLGNGKRGTGGVRVINKDQKVTENIFYQCRGADFRSPLTIMNGIPNSPANRYVQVIHAEISSNVFYGCSPLSFCEGSDTERTLPPSDVQFSGNNFYSPNSAPLFVSHDSLNGFRFSQNKVNGSFSGTLSTGFSPAGKNQQELEGLSSRILAAERNAIRRTGAGWFNKDEKSRLGKLRPVSCNSAAEVYKALAGKGPLLITLTGENYEFEQPLVIGTEITIRAFPKKQLSIRTTSMPALFIVEGKGQLTLEGLIVEGQAIHASGLIAGSLSGSPDHFSIRVRNCGFSGLSRQNDCRSFLSIHKNSVADSIVIEGSVFRSNDQDLLLMNEETGDKGYYNAEKIVVRDNEIADQKGMLMDLYRGGSDESTMGPWVIFSQNLLSNCNTGKGEPLIAFSGIQLTVVGSNKFTNCNKGSLLIRYKDWVKAHHELGGNRINGSGLIEKNRYVNEK